MAWGLIGFMYSQEYKAFELTSPEVKKKPKPRTPSKAKCTPATFLTVLRGCEKIQFPTTGLPYSTVGQKLRPGKIGLSDAKLLVEFLNKADWLKNTLTLRQVLYRLEYWTDKAKAWDKDRKKGQPQTDYKEARR